MTATMTRAEWLEARRQGLGASDAAAVCGVDPWRTPLSVYVDKTTPGYEIATNDRMLFGQLVEPVLIDEWAQRTGRNIERDLPMRAHPDHEWMLATLDAWEIDEQAPVEAKTVWSHHAARKWQSPDEPYRLRVPDWYMLQVQHQIAVCGSSHAYVVALIEGELESFRVDADPKLIDIVVTAERRFWTDHVLAGVEPAYTEADDLAAIYSPPHPGEQVELDDTDMDVLRRRKAAKDRVKMAEAEITDADQHIKHRLQHATEGTFNGDVVARWSRYDRHVLDSKQLREAHPELADEFTATIPASRLTIKENLI